MRTFFKALFERLGIPAYWLRQNLRELQAIAIRIWAFLPIQRRRVRVILAGGPVRLNFGCGATRYSGWIGIDCSFAQTVDLTLDLRRKLPFPDASVDLCYSEHFLEHLYPDEGLRHLAEVSRVLKPDGRYRVALPDVMKFARRYLEGDEDFFRRAFPWAQRPMEAFYCVANWGGEHRNILDLRELEYLGLRAGFAMVRESRANASDVVALRIDIADPQRVEESFYAELLKSPP